MAGIVELYRQHKDLLSLYFKSEKEAADCERRAEMGDDRAMRVLSLAYSYEAPSFQKGDVPHSFKSTQGGSNSEWTNKEWWVTHLPLNGKLRDSLHQQAQGAHNPYAISFVDSITLGHRSCVEPLPYIHIPWHLPTGQSLPAKFVVDKSMGDAYARRMEAVKKQSAAVQDYKESSHSDRIRKLKEAGSYRYEICPSPDGPDDKYDRRNYTTFNLLSMPSDTSRWLADTHGFIPNSKEYKFAESQNYLDNVKALETCMRAGDAAAARLLSHFYSQRIFYEICTKARLFGTSEYLYNKHFNSEKAKYCERIADHLEGKSVTPIEREKFLKEFLFSQDKTPEGLYNIGYALHHNSHIADKARGLDYLKHAANLGDANAARELGEIHQSLFDEKGDKSDLQKANFWYGVAATTPMKVTGADGKAISYDGHPNAKARVAYLAKAYPELAQVQLNEKEVRNPSRSHFQQYPNSMWDAEIPITDFTDLIRNPAHGGLMVRMEGAVKAIDTHVNEFEALTGSIQAKIEELVARQAVLNGRVEGKKEEEIGSLKYNDGLSAEQRKSERAKGQSYDRWVKETRASLVASFGMGMLTGGASFVDQMFDIFGHGSINDPGTWGKSLMMSNKVRAAGYRAVMKNEMAYHQAIIDELESRKIDTSKFPDEIRSLAEAVQQVADSGPMQKLRQDETRARAIVEGYLRQRILKSALDNCRDLEDYSKQNGVASVDALLATFEKQDARLYEALSNLCYGHANSNDMAVLLADVNAMRGDNLQPHEKALKRFVERVVKGDIAHFMTRASQIDVIADLKLVDFSTMSVDHSKATADLVRGVKDLSAEEQAKNQVDAATKLALTSMFSQQFGVTHIGQYDVTRMFSYYLHRHGRKELIAAELYDGQVDMTRKPKAVNVLDKANMESFVERATEAAHRYNEKQPDMDDRFLRTCGYEYYLPQAVITSGRGNRFRENPEAPVAYPMVNTVVQNFIERMSLTDIAAYRQQVGETLDGLIAQTFFDFFQQVGREHAQKFAVEREQLRDAYNSDSYKRRFITHEDKITEDVLAKFPEFLKIYERNLAKVLQGMPEPEAAILQQQIASLQQNTKDYLAPNVPEPGSFQAREDARKRDHSYTNMTEGRRFTG